MAIEVAQGDASQALGAEGSASTATESYGSGNTFSSTPVAETTEKHLPQSQVNEIVQREKRHAYDKGLREAEAKYQSSQNQNQSMGGVPQDISVERIQQLAADAAQKQYQSLIDDHQKTAQMNEAQRVANEFIGKMEQGKAHYSDFDNVVGQLEYKEIPHIVHLANTTDNTADIMYELANNPSKIATLTMLMQTSPKLAQMEMAKLSSSIKKNMEAKSSPQANAPLSQIPHSTVGTDTGKLTVRDYRKQPWLRA